MPSIPLYHDRQHFAPSFEISLQSGAVDSNVLRDVQQVNYSESEVAMDSFEFVLNDWDPDANTVIYSSPYDEAGKLRKVNGVEITNFDPGTVLTLKMGYTEHADEPMIMMQGTVLSVEPSFPASGLPTVTIRAVSKLNKYLNASHTEEFKVKKPSEIFESLATNQMGFDPGKLQTPNKANEGPLEYQLISKESPLVFLAELAKTNNYHIRMLTDATSGDESLYFGPQIENDSVLELMWGRSLISFAPKVQTKSLVEKVEISGWDPKASGDDRDLTVEATADDLNISLNDPKLLDTIKTQIEGSVKSVTNENFASEAQAQQRAKDILSEMYRGLITASGSCVGDPRIRTGTTLSVTGLGIRYDGDYLVTQATHNIAGSGYVVSFDCVLKGVVA